MNTKHIKCKIRSVKLNGLPNMNIEDKNIYWFFQESCLSLRLCQYRKYEM